MVDAAVGGRPQTAAEVIDALRSVKDPEVPVIDVVELGIVRGATVEGGRVTVSVTPTYSGCPATQVIEREIRRALVARGFEEVVVNTVLFPAWTTDWIAPEGREKLRVYGIAPPGPAAELELVQLGRPAKAVPCPWCGSSNTTRESEFGSTACKSIHSCHSCHQPFEHFKPL
ncbi:MAG: phenylacetate-CoA oxygenase subunit PaaJ [Gemmatimonadetes bacterium]|nr:phenylacetate-CoA oxygenase subunit PaaJ [Gemmatimonadota bacterium]